MLSIDEKITFRFNNGEEAIDLDDRIFSVVDYTGLEASDIEIQTDSNINHDGEYLRRKKILPREISVTFDALSTANTSELRQTLIRFFSPYKDGVLKIRYMGVIRYIDYMVSGFSISSKNVYEPLSAMVTVKCLDPAFRTQTIEEEIETLVGGWSWKFSLPFSLKQKGELKIDIMNDGDLETPVEIYFKGPATNPEVKLNDKSYIRLKKSITSDETLYINTAFRKKTVQIISGNTKTDAWDYLDMTSDFFWLAVGENTIEYSNTGISDDTGVTISYRKKYLGV